jgi:GNAT superfamily N-acetyltransferase
MEQADPWSEPFDENVVRLSLRDLLQNTSYGVLYLAWDGDRSVAYLAICFDYSLEYRGKGAWIDEPFVEASRRGQRIGSGLLHLAETVSREHSARFLHLEVSHGNPTIKLYRGVAASITSVTS